MVSVDELLAKAKPRETTVPICLAGDLNARHEELSRQLAAAGDAWVPDSLSQPNSRLAIAEQITALEREMTEHLHVFRFRALPRSKFRALRAAHPPRDDVVPPEGLFNYDTFAPALVAACCIDPEFTDVSQVEELYDAVGQGGYDLLFTGAWGANMGVSDVPKSALASMTIRTTAPN